VKRVRLDAKIIFSVCVFLISIIYLFSAKNLVLGTMKRPGVGFLPILSGTLLAIFSMIEIIKITLNKSDSSKVSIEWKKIAIFFLGIIIYALLLNPIGYLFATFGLLLFLAKLFGAKSWVKPLIFSIILSGASYYLFAELLLVQLP
jgi:putative tricarboxylic transport membrane protein